MKKLDLNSLIRVKLTDYGKDIYYHRFDEFNKFISNRFSNRSGKLIEPCYPETDDDGLTEFHLWEFIELYGPYMHMEAKNVIEPLCIYIDDCDLED